MRQLVRPVWLAVLLLSAVAAYAQDFSFDESSLPEFSPSPPPAPSTQTPMPAASSMTPEMWLYLQEYRRWNDPKEIVRRRAAQRAAERRMRMAALEWYGYSNQRPMAHPTPHTASYSPTWVGSLVQPYHWAGIGAYPRVIRVEPAP
jgi:hypothetical protein